MRQMSGLRSAIGRLVILSLVVSAVPSIAYAQVPSRMPDQRPVPAPGLLRTASLNPGPLDSKFTDGRRRARVRRTHVQGKSRRSAVGWGVLGGVVAGVVVAGVGARRYGENERGEFCTRCFVTWSAVTIPVGAGVGALAGYLVDVARR
jgi:hypothetical protein